MGAKKRQAIYLITKSIQPSPKSFLGTLTTRFGHQRSISARAFSLLMPSADFLSYRMANFGWEGKKPENRELRRHLHPDTPTLSFFTVEEGSVGLYALCVGRQKELV